MPEPSRPIVIHPEVQGTAEDFSGGMTVRSPRDRRLDPPRYPRENGDDDLSPPPPELAPPGTKRAHSLDALRGLFLVSMTAGFTIAGEVFPLWMYHRQTPADTLVDVAGITWRDLAYGAFLFTMAAALPLTLSRRIQKGETEIAIILASIRRFLLLLFFALLIGHSNTYFTGYTDTARAIAIVGFCIMGLVFTRRRSDWNERTFRAVNLTGWGLAIAFLAFTPLLYGEAFSFERTDDIIVGLAFAALSGSIIWYVTRDNWLARVVLLGIAVALYLGARGDGWVQEWWYYSPFPWLFVPSRFTLLIVVIPGTIIGDMVLRWMRSSAARELPTWPGARVAALATLSAIITPILVVGLYNRWVHATTQLVGAILLAGLLLTLHPRTATERLLRSQFLCGGALLLAGLFVEPFEGGIKKAPETLSYFFTIAGSTTMLLVTLTALIDVLGRRKWVSALIDFGHNPLLAYVLFSVLLNSLIGLTPLGGALQGSAGEALLRSLVLVVVVVVLVRFVSRRRIFWRT